MKGFEDDNNCFVCGALNSGGLRLTFSGNDEIGEVTSKAVFSDRFQGWKGVLHGGIISTVLDEIMIKAAHRQGFKCVTAELNVRFKKPAYTNTQYLIKGKIIEVRKKLVITEGVIIGPNKEIIASAAGKLFIL
jgi:uncharacterized protein (TIGR00369 family)